VIAEHQMSQSVTSANLKKSLEVLWLLSDVAFFVSGYTLTVNRAWTVH
jgi:hypothetical protein